MAARDAVEQVPTIAWNRCPPSAECAAPAPRLDPACGEFCGNRAQTDSTCRRYIGDDCCDVRPKLVCICRQRLLGAPLLSFGQNPVQGIQRHRPPLDQAAERLPASEGIGSAVCPVAFERKAAQYRRLTGTAIYPRAACSRIIRSIKGSCSVLIGTFAARR